MMVILGCVEWQMASNYVGLGGLLCVVVVFQFAVSRHSDKMV